jgi:hypothetical protein
MNGAGLCRVSAHGLPDDGGPEHCAAGRAARRSGESGGRLVVDEAAFGRHVSGEDTPRTRRIVAGAVRADRATNATASTIAATRWAG